MAKKNSPNARDRFSLVGKPGRNPGKSSKSGGKQKQGNPPGEKPKQWSASRLQRRLRDRGDAFDEELKKPT